MKKKLTSFVLAAALVMSLPVAVSAAETAPAINLEPIVTAVSDGGAGAVSPMSVDASSIGAIVLLKALFLHTPHLVELPLGRYVRYTSKKNMVAHGEQLPVFLLQYTVKQFIILIR